MTALAVARELPAGLGDGPLPPAGFDFDRRRARRLTHHYTGFAAHWNKNANFGNAFDQWFLNLFAAVAVRSTAAATYAQLHSHARHDDPDRWRDGGCASRRRELVARFVIAGAIGIAAGLTLHVAGLVLIVG